MRVLKTLKNPFKLNYYGIFYGPSVAKPGSLQPDASGIPDARRPLMMKNFLGLGYQLSPEMTVTATADWLWQPVLGQQFSLQDPFVMISHNSIFHRDGFNLYADVRGHMGVTSQSRQNDFLFGLQTFQALTYELEGTGFVFGLYSSERFNVFGKQGYGDTFELYLAPNIYYQFTPKLAFSLLYGIQSSKFYGIMGLHRDGLSFQPGINWDVTSTLSFNPYLNIPTDGKFTLGSISLGMFLSWAMM